MKRGIIYKIICNITGEQYIGSTFMNLKKRIADHKAKSNKCSSKQIIDRGDWRYEKIMDCYVKDKNELRKIEQNFIDNNPCINKLCAFQTEEEKEEKNRIRCKNYYHANKIIINQKIYCCCGSEISKKNKTRHERTKKHKDYIENLEQEYLKLLKRVQKLEQKHLELMKKVQELNTK